MSPTSLNVPRMPLGPVTAAGYQPAYYPGYWPANNMAPAMAGAYSNAWTGGR
jgi:hypothetical protein